MDTKDYLRSALEVAQQQLAELSEQAAPLLVALDQKRREVSLIREALNLGEPEESRPLGEFNRVMSDTINVLKSVGKPLTIGQIYRALIEAGAEIPGKGDQANLISHLRRCNAIRRVGRGVYGLVEWDDGDDESRA